jgi:hypothetical protein
MQKMRQEHRQKFAKILKCKQFKLQILIFTLGLSPSQDENAGGLENSETPAKFPNHSQK